MARPRVFVYDVDHRRAQAIESPAHAERLPADEDPHRGRGWEAQPGSSTRRTAGSPGRSPVRSAGMARRLVAATMQAGTGALRQCRTAGRGHASRAARSR